MVSFVAALGFLLYGGRLVFGIMFDSKKYVEHQLFKLCLLMNFVILHLPWWILCTIVQVIFHVETLSH